MSKFFLVIVLFAVSSSVQGAPLDPFDEIENAAATGQWDTLQKLIFKNFAMDGWKETVPLGGVKELKPPAGGHVYGESEYTFNSASNFNGQKTVKSAGHKVINDDGQVVEFDFTPPALGQEHLLKSLGFKSIKQS